MDAVSAIVNLVQLFVELDQNYTQNIFDKFKNLISHLEQVKLQIDVEG